MVHLLNTSISYIVITQKMIEVIENEDKSFTITWDETSPTESILNTWTEDDFIRVIMEHLEKVDNDPTTSTS